ncbi:MULTISPECIES: HAMP domain-containing sensor histidine kinase [unclassified Rhizobium]|jgi:signal transduction histidine kinase|uniref:sensor histidine kinase n=1 Tax=unclassified Rhizobium TaxID=2613769 RepID=UPI000646F074|nr:MULTISPECIES: HAMP domain-containing sensor histidine kinase [unclassified Rhizobium]MBN8950549.1 HAMP domain-containing histidine kinase [Rhizobium tropici]OJY66106.1 MAG: two-component sensor histidine kinase [Rhizobium sp. 60-20]RKD69353.1 signal transduction histidine kinase [Rhizobium sp. WW_1]
MTPERSRSLRWGLIKRLIALQAFLLVLFFVLLVGWIWIINPELEDANEEAVRVVAQQITRDDDGQLQVAETHEVVELKQRYPELWFMIRDHKGILFQYGEIPTAALTESFPWTIDRARVEAGNGAHATVENRETSVGKLQIMAATERGFDNDGLNVWINMRVEVPKGPHGEIHWLDVLPAMAFVIFIGVAPILALTGVATLLVTPRAVGRSLTGLVETATQAQAIDFDTRSARLDRSKVPTEIIPLVDAFNHALSKLDEGYNRHNRFLADAAHELRTPIAIARTRADLLPEAEVSHQLRDDIDRLSRVAHQLLEMQAIGVVELRAEKMDLNMLVENIAADLAPIAMDAGYDFDFEPSKEEAIFVIQASTIEMAVVNLIRNAIDHAGGKGSIVVRVGAAGTIDVCDEGPGIPPEERDRVFEPFRRINASSSGAGLGLNLVKKAAELHGGRISFLYTSHGFCVRLQIGSIPPSVVVADMGWRQKP